MRPLLPVLIITGLIGFYAHEIHLNQERAFFSQALSRAHTEESVSLQGKTYAIKDGEMVDEPVSKSVAVAALRLAYEKTLARRNPFLSLAGTDPQELTATVQKLTDLEDALGHIQKTPGDAALVRQALFPTHFLSAAAHAEAARNQFLVSGTAADGRTYERALKSAIVAYQSDLANYQDAFKRAVPSSVRPYTTAGLLITYGGAAGALQTLQKNGARLNASFAARLACIRGSMASCDTAALSFPALSKPDAPPPQNLAIPDAIRALYAEALRDPRVYDGPLLALTSSACSTGPALFAEYLSSWAMNSPLAWLLYVGDIHFIDTERFPTVPFEAYFAHHGVAYAPSDPLAHYNCPYWGTDYGKAFGLKAVAQTAQTNPLSAELSGSAQSTLRALEAPLRSTTLLEESDALRYVAQAQEIAASPDAPASFKNQVAELSLILTDPSAGFSEAADRLIELEDRNFQAISRNGLPIDLSAETLFYYRSGFIFFFMGDNRTAVSQPDTFFPPYYAQPGDAKPFTTYRELNPQGIFKTHLAKEMTLYFDTHRVHMAP